MKIYTIIGGVNGTGKSSLTGVLKAVRNDLGTIIDADKLAAEYHSSILGGKKAIEKINRCFALGVSFTQETTLSGIRTEHTAKRAKEAGYYIRLYYVGLNTAEESLKRIQNRVQKGGHDIPKADVFRRFSGRFEALGKILSYCDEASFFDNENGFIEIAEYKNAELIQKEIYPPKWFRELEDQIEKQ